MFALVMTGENRVFQISKQKFDVSPPFKWEKSPVGATIDWKYLDGEIKEPILALNEVKKNQVSILTANCAEAIVAGFSSDALGEPHIYPNDIKDQINLMGAVVSTLVPDMGKGETPIWCRSKEEWSFRCHTSSQIQKVWADAARHITDCRETLSRLLASVEAARTEKSVMAILWPASPIDT